MRKSVKRQTPEQWEATLNAEVLMWRQTATSIEHTWDEAVADYLQERTWSDNKRNTILTLRRLEPYLKGRLLIDINRGRIAEIQKALLARGLLGSTINRIVSIIIAILNRTVAWEWMDRAPKVESLPESPPRDRFLDRASAERLLRELPPHLRAMVVFALETGLRRSNVTHLRWDWIDLERRVASIPVEYVKGKSQPVTIPLTARAFEVLKIMSGQNDSFVFTFKGKPVTQTATKAFRKALKRAGIVDFRWHDLRHTWASWHAQGGTPEMYLQQLGGWRSQKMVARYAHLNVEHLRPFVEKHEGLPKIALNLLREKA